MPKLTSPLDHVRIAAPCPADWDQMFSFEDKRVRFCSQCNLNVYNLSGMSRHEAEALITKPEGRLCVRFYRKSDGSILTQNCPVGLKAIKRRMAKDRLGINVSARMSSAKRTTTHALGFGFDSLWPSSDCVFFGNFPFTIS